jgi:hypothetical protein
LRLGRFLAKPKLTKYIIAEVDDKDSHTKITLGLIQFYSSFIHGHTLRARALTKGNTTAYPAGKDLCDEIILGNVDIVSSLLDFGHSVEGTAKHRPIMAAAQANNIEIFQFLVDHGASLSSDNDTYPSLFHALASRPPQSRCDLGIARLLLSEGVIIPPTPSSYSPIAAAILSNDYPLVSLFVSHTSELGSHLNNLIPATNSKSSFTLLGALIRSQTPSSPNALAYLTRSHIRSSLSPLALVDDGSACSVGACPLGHSG